MSADEKFGKESQESCQWRVTKTEARERLPPRFILNKDTELLL